MIKACLKIMVFSTAIFCTFSYADEQNALPDVYSQCVDQMIEENQLGGINNAVVDSCSNLAKSTYEKQIVKLLDRIKKYSEIDQQPERYKAIMKSQQLWKIYVDQECSNAGEYIGSPMYSFCPMQEYAKRVEQLTEYTH